MTAMGFSRKILFGEIVNVIKYPTTIFSGFSYKWLDDVIRNRGNGVSYNVILDYVIYL